MTPNEFKSLSKEILCELQKEVAPEGKCILIWQDPTFIGFAKISGNSLEIQPEGPDNLDFELLQDCRIIGKKGEYHLWKTPGGDFKGRLRLSKNVPAENVLKDIHYLWGTDFCPQERNASTAWTCVTEQRGMRLWLPWKHHGSLPACLEVRHIVEPDPFGMAAIVDSFFLLPTQMATD